MTKEKYFMICDQMGEEPNPEKIPPEVEDFPLDVQKAMMIYNNLGDRIVLDVGYLGKDYTAVPLYMDVYNVVNRDLFLETLSRIDKKVIADSAEQMKQERKKMQAKK